MRGGSLPDRGASPAVQAVDSHPRRIRRRHVALVGALAMVAALLAGCGGDDGAEADAGDAGDVVPSQALRSAGDAAAARGSELDEAPGPADRTPFDGFGEVAIAVRDADGQVMGWCVLVAETDEQHQRGLMEVTDLKGYAGMLFVWESDIQAQFYMQNTPMPLSIAWFDPAGQLVSTEDMDPCETVGDCPLYGAAGPYRFALEVPQGELPGLGVEEGSVLRVGGDCAARSP
jgi:uncharacterized membrane protein (UPF0127 family)